MQVTIFTSFFKGLIPHWHFNNQEDAHEILIGVMEMLNETHIRLGYISLLLWHNETIYLY